MTGSGGRYIDWTHVTVVGNPAAAAPHVAEGRKMLGYVWDEAKRNNLGVHQLTRTMADGTVIVAEKHGDIPRITIMPVEGGGDTRKNRIRGFVCKPTSQDFPEGFNPDFPEAAIVSDGDAGSWATLYYDRRDPPWEDIPGGKSTYPNIGGLPGFPDGLTKYGNVDWIGDKEERVSWMGSDLRYIYARPQSTDNRVFRAGKVLLNVPDTEWSGIVRGACIRGMNLLVVIASQTDYGSNGESTYRLIRVPLAPAPPEDGLANLVSIPGDAESLWTATLGRDPASFFFNQSGTVACYVGGKSTKWQDRQLVTLSITEAGGVWSATHEVTAIGGVVTSPDSSQDIPYVSYETIEKYGTQSGESNTTTPGTGSGVLQQLAGIGATVLLARDFKEDVPVDVTMTIEAGTTADVSSATNTWTWERYYLDFFGDEQMEGAGSAFGTILRRNRTKRARLQCGATTVLLWHMFYTENFFETGYEWASTTVGAPNVAELEAKGQGLVGQLKSMYPPPSAQVMEMAVITGLDARVDGVAFYDVKYEVPGGVNANVFDLPRAITAPLVFRTGQTDRVIKEFAGNLAAGSNWVVLDPDSDLYLGGSEGAHIVSLSFSVGGGSFFGEKPSDGFIPTLQGWFSPLAAPWILSQGSNDNLTVTTSLSVLTPDEILYAGADPTAPGESIASATGGFDPWERTAITGANRKIHPTWVLPTTSVETEI